MPIKAEKLFIMGIHDIKSATIPKTKEAIAQPDVESLKAKN